MYVYYTRTYMFYKTLVKTNEVDFPGGPVVRSLPANAGDMGLIPGLGRFHMPQNSETRAPQTL